LVEDKRIAQSNYPFTFALPFFLKNHLLKTLSKGCYLIKASNGQEIYSEKLMIE